MNILEAASTLVSAIHESLNKEITSAIVIGFLFLIRSVVVKIWKWSMFIPSVIKKQFKNLTTKITKKLLADTMEEYMKSSLEKKFADLNHTFRNNSQKIDNVIREHQATQTELFLIMEEMRTEIKDELHNVLQSLNDKRE